MTVDWKKKLLPNLPYLLFVYLFDLSLIHISEPTRH